MREDRVGGGLGENETIIIPGKRMASKKCYEGIRAMI